MVCWYITITILVTTKMCVNMYVYPLVMTNIAIEHDHRNSGFSHWQRWFSIVFCMFTRGYMIWLCVQPCKINCPWLHPKPSPTGIAMLQSSWSQHQLWNKTKGPSYYRVTRPGKRLHNWWERSTVVNGKIHYKWSCSIAMLNYQRLSLLQQGTCETGDYGWTRMKQNIYRTNESIADRVAKTINMPDITVI